MITRDPEKCHYCDKAAMYSQLVGKPGNYSVSGVCKDHLVMDLNS